MTPILIPWIILAMLGSPDPATVEASLDAEANTICWSTPTEALCFPYSDEGTHLEVTLEEIL